MFKSSTLCNRYYLEPLPCWNTSLPNKGWVNWFNKIFDNLFQLINSWRLGAIHVLHDVAPEEAVKRVEVRTVCRPCHISLIRNYSAIKWSARNLRLLDVVWHISRVIWIKFQLKGPHNLDKTLYSTIFVNYQVSWSGEKALLSAIAVTQKLVDFFNIFRNFIKCPNITKGKMKDY